MNNIITQTLEAAANHTDNPIIVSLTSKLEMAREQYLMIMNTTCFNQFAGYEECVKGTDGYGLMYTVRTDFFKSPLEAMDKLREIAVITECLITALNAIGENIVH